MTRPSPTRDAVLAALAGGPKTRGELEALLGKSLQATMYALLKSRLVHVHDWLRGTGNMRALRMIYAAGDGEDAPKPSADRLGKYKRYYQNHKPVLKAKRKISFPKYRDKVNAAARRRRAKQKLKSNPFIQLSPELYRDLKRRATRNAKRLKSGKGVPAQPTRRYTTEDARDGGGVGRAWTGVRQIESGELASAPPDQQAG